MTALALLTLILPGNAAAPAPYVPHWVKIPIVSADAKKAGAAGGEGGQWPRGPVAVSPADPNFLLLAIDVGGLYRSLDGGKNWQSAMVGWDARGANGFAIDPKNAAHVLGIGTNSMNWDPNWGPSPLGLYRSTDKAASWTHVLALNGAFNGAVAFDPGSYDPAQGGCTRAYYLADDAGLFRSDDAGAIWTLVHAKITTTPSRDWTQGGGFTSMLKIGASGAVYVAGNDGLFRSDDRGKTFAALRPGEVDGLALASDGTLYLSNADGVSASRDGGKTFAALPCQGLDREAKMPVVGLTVSPADPKRLLCWATGTNFQWPRYVSQDGSATWQKVTTDNTLSDMPVNGRQGYMAWHPTDPNIAWGIGGDWVTKSTDGGKTFHWANNGYNGIMLGGLFNFSAHDPNTVYLGFQDYNGAFTTDGGATWNYRNISGLGWGGQEYGAHAVDKTVMWSGDAGSSWYGPRHLRLTRDGGTTWNFVNGPDGKPLAFGGPDVSLSDPTNAAVLFASNLRSADKGLTWTAMPDCDGVFTFSPGTKALYGKKGDSIVRSTDHGVTWIKLADVEGGFVDLAVDHKTGRIYVASQDHLKVWQSGTWTTLDTPHDQFGQSRVWTVATDPQQPSIVYIGGPRNTYASHATVCRSLDGGKTWENLTVNTPLSGASSAGAGAGPHEVSAIRVNPVTRWAWVNGQCYGMWKIAPPLPGERGVSAAEASAPPAVAPPAPTMTATR